MRAYFSEELATESFAYNADYNTWQYSRYSLVYTLWKEETLNSNFGSRIQFFKNKEFAFQ